MSDDGGSVLIVIGGIAIIFAIIFGSVSAIVFGPAILSSILAEHTSRPLVATIALINDLTHSPDATIAQAAPYLIAALTIAGVALGRIAQAYDAYQMARDAKEHLSRNSS
jgi:hypothetical protein